MNTLILAETATTCSKFDVSGFALVLLVLLLVPVVLRGLNLMKSMTEHHARTEAILTRIAASLEKLENKP